MLSPRTSLPWMVMLEALPSPVALMRTLPPALTLEPAAVVVVVVVVLSCVLLPTVREALRRPGRGGLGARHQWCFWRLGRW
ncbi:hypothetical protein C5H21_01325 [Xylella fastidiosa]|nr:hypothetical protein C5H21_14285 [Xylella fastidiosa]TNW00133.1 hypothetical protein C5H21_01325 [Xylella fastidiosa]